jgi:hypothetical protein
LIEGGEAERTPGTLAYSKVHERQTTEVDVCVIAVVPVAHIPEKCPGIVDWVDILAYMVC